MPAWPVDVSCQYFLDKKSTDLLTAMRLSVVCIFFIYYPFFFFGRFIYFCWLLILLIISREFTTTTPEICHASTLTRTFLPILVMMLGTTKPVPVCPIKRKRKKDRKKKKKGS